MDMTSFSIDQLYGSESIFYIGIAFVSLACFYKILEKTGFGKEQQIVAYVLILLCVLTPARPEYVFAIALWVFAFIYWPVDKLRVHVRRSAVKEIAPSKYPDCISIKWDFDSHYGGEVKTEEREELLARFQELMLKGLEETKLAINTAIIETPEGMAWQWYANSGDSFIEETNRILSVIKRLPLGFHLTKDPDWDYYKNLWRYEKLNFSQLCYHKKSSPLEYYHVAD